MGKLWEHGRKRMGFFHGKNYWQQALRKRERIRAGVVGLAVSALFVWLFYRNVSGIIVGIPIFLYIWKEGERTCIAKKKAEFQEQFKEAMQALATAMKVGYSAENAIREAKKELNQLYGADTVILKAFTEMTHKLDVRIPAEQVVEEFAKELKTEEVISFATVFSIAKRSGGNMVSILEKAVERICEKAELEKEIAAVTAAKRMEFHVMSAIPLGMLLYMEVSFPEFLFVLYETTAGVLVMTVCLGAYLAAYLFGRRIVEIEV